MKISNTVLALPVSVFFLLWLTTPTAALTIIVDDQGTASFYEGQVLGREDRPGAANSAVNSAAGRGSAPNAGGSATSPGRAVYSTPAYQNRNVRIQPTKDTVKVMVEEANSVMPQMAPSSAAGSGKSMERPHADKVMESKTVRMEMPVTPFRAAETEQTNATSQPRMMEAESAVEVPALSEYQQQLRKERRERVNAQVEIQSRAENSGQRLELRSGEYQARLQQGAEVVVDPDTSEVRVITPAGQERVLNHLPDQAVERIRAAQTSDRLNLGEATPEVITTEDGTVQYQVETTQRKRLFGLFNREVPTTVTLDDATGEVTERQLTTNPVQQILNILSF